MHLKVPSSFMLVVMADGWPNLCSKKLVYSHMHFSAEHWNYRPVNTCIETPLWSTKGWWYWKSILVKSPKYNFGHCGPKLEHFTNKKKWKMAPVPKNADFGAAHGLYNGPLKPANAHTDDDRYDMVELGAAGESLIGPLRSATRMQHGFQSINPV